MTQRNPHPVPGESGRIVPAEVRGWQKGYDAGISSPPDVPPTPSVRHTGFMHAWAEGAAAGNADGRTEGWRWAYFDGGAVPQPGDAGSYGPRASGEPEADFAQSWACVGERPLRVLLALFAPGDEAEDGLVGRTLARACADKGVARLYLPVLTSSSGPAAEPTGDALLDAGFPARFGDRVPGRGGPPGPAGGAHTRAPLRCPRALHPRGRTPLLPLAGQLARRM